MVKEEISINELLEKFNLKLKLPENILDYRISSDFLKAEYKKEKNNYTFSVDDVVLIINPKDKKETVQKLVMKDEKIIGGIILGHNSYQYLN